MPEHVPKSMQVKSAAHAEPLSPVQPLGVPPQYLLPEPGPVLSHQPFTPQIVPVGQSLFDLHLATQIPAPMHIGWFPGSPAQSLSCVHAAAHWPLAT